MRLNRLIAIALSVTVFAATALPQQPAPAATPAAAKPAEAQAPAAPSTPPKIVVLQGEGAKNNIKAKTAVAPVVEVRDDADKPISGAEVIFQLPPTGASGVFHGWMRTQTVRTNAQGQATVTGYTPNDEAGRFNMKVTATTRTGTASAVIAQANVAGTGTGAGVKKAHSGWWKLAAVAGAAALGGGIYAATRNGDSTSSTAVTTVPVAITAGPITVAGPR